MKIECPFDEVLQNDLEKIAAADLPWERLRGKTVLITGATGLVGSALVRTLMTVSRVKGIGVRVLAMVRSVEKAEAVFGHLLERPELEVVCADVRETVQIGGAVDYIIHTASNTASREFLTHPVETLDIMVSGTKHLLELARKKQSASFVYISSMEMYGTMPPSARRTREDELGYIDLVRVRSCYPEGKRLCENMCACYAAEYGVHARIARLAQTFGAGVSAKDNRVFAQFARAAMAGEDIVLHTEGRSNGNYCYLADAVTGILCVLFRGADGEAYNVVSEATTTTIWEMACMVAEKISGGKSRVIFDIPEDAMKFGYAADVQLRLSGAKLESLGWRPAIAPELEQMYRRLIASYTSQINQER